MILYSIHLHPGRGTKHSLGEDRPFVNGELHLSFARCVTCREIDFNRAERESSHTCSATRANNSIRSESVAIHFRVTVHSVPPISASWNVVPSQTGAQDLLSVREITSLSSRRYISRILIYSFPRTGLASPIGVRGITMVDEGPAVAENSEIPFILNRVN